MKENRSFPNEERHKSLEKYGKKVEKVVEEVKVMKRLEENNLYDDTFITEDYKKQIMKTVTNRARDLSNYEIKCIIESNEKKVINLYNELFEAENILKDENTGYSISLDMVKEMDLITKDIKELQEENRCFTNVMNNRLYNCSRC